MCNSEYLIFNFSTLLNIGKIIFNLFVILTEKSSSKSILAFSLTKLFVTSTIHLLSELYIPVIQVIHAIVQVLSTLSQSVLSEFGVYHSAVLQLINFNLSVQTS